MKKSFGYGIFGVLILIALWSIGGHILFSNPDYEQFTSFLPVPTFKALYVLILEMEFWNSVYASLKRICVGISIAFLFGMPMGLCIGFYKNLSYITYPPFQFLRMISPISWMPIALLIFRSFESAIIFLITMASIWPIIINITLGVARVNPQWLHMARDQGAKNYQLIFRIIFPSTLPYIVTSLRMALGIAWIVLVPAEFLGISSGLGYIINDARDTMEYDRLMAIVISIGIIGSALDVFIQLLRRTFRWSYENDYIF